MVLISKTAAELREAKRQSRTRFEAIAALYVPAGYIVEYRRSLSGKCDFARKLIQAPRPVTRKALYIFLHECAHANLPHRNRHMPSHVKEMEAEQWAHAKMREHGVAVPRDMTKRAKAYVARKITQAERHGAKKISSRARRFASS